VDFDFDTDKRSALIVVDGSVDLPRGWRVASAAPATASTATVRARCVFVGTSPLGEGRPGEELADKENHRDDPNPGENLLLITRSTRGHGNFGHAPPLINVLQIFQ
jgi:hypothetical protein